MLHKMHQDCRQRFQRQNGGGMFIHYTAQVCMDTISLLYYVNNRVPVRQGELY